MTNKIQKIEKTCLNQDKLRRIAAYARVSVLTDCTQNSLKAQVDYYRSYIQSQEAWQYVGVYADNGISGTKENRAQFKQMLKDCEDGKINLILTKSISRFARNTLHLLEVVRILKDMGVEIRFERENISSFSADGELLLTILASFAQEESRSISENVKWAIRKGFEQGQTNSHKLYGYRWVDGHFIPKPEEAKIVQFIFTEYQKGASIQQLQASLDSMGAKAPNGGSFSSTTLRSLLRQEKYSGNILVLPTF